MKKKNIIIVVAISVLFIGSIILFAYFRNLNDYQYSGAIFYLDNEYYNQGNFIDISANDLDKMLKDKKTFLLYSYNNYCSLPIPCENIFEEIMKKYKFDVLQITFEDFKKTTLYDSVKLAPTLIIIKNGTIVDYLKADKDEDLSKYQEKTNFENWLKEYIILKK